LAPAHDTTVEETSTAPLAGLLAVVQSGGETVTCVILILSTQNQPSPETQTPLNRNLKSEPTGTEAAGITASKVAHSVMPDA